MIINRFFNYILSSAAFAALLLAGMWTSDAKADHPSFKDHVFPILRTYCLDCHQPGGAGYEKSGLDMRTYESLMKGTKFGPMIIPGDAFTSNLMVLIEGRSRFGIRMPYVDKRDLSRWEKYLIRSWINRGAKNN